METVDYTTWVTKVDGDTVYYENTVGKKWWIKGYCNQCGLCETIPKPFVLNETYEHTTKRMHPVTKEIDYWTRILKWVAEPGTPGACVEVNYADRGDIVVTPDLVNSIEKCTYTGGWL